MIVDIKSLMSQVSMLRLKSEALVADVRVLDQTLRDAVAEALKETKSVEPAFTDATCNCPASQRYVIRAQPGVPVKTKCRQCGKEHVNGES